MASRRRLTPIQVTEILILDKPKRLIQPADLAAALGADPYGKHLVNFDLISLAELGVKEIAKQRQCNKENSANDEIICRK